MEKISLLNVSICSIRLNDLLSQVKQGVLITPNVDHLVKLQKDQEFADCYRAAEWVICDSKIINLAATFLNKPFKEVIPGSTFFPAFYKYHRHNKDIKIFLLGAKEGVAQRAMNKINAQVGWNMVVDTYSPPFGFENQEAECKKIIDIIISSGANVLVVGLGAPKQEKWIMKYKNELPGVNLFMALGATIDFEAGNIQRAPILIQKLCLESLYRLYKEPKRLWRRYLIEDPAFFTLVLKQKFGLYRVS
jgi:N-acetylglucosaminyldiphosphoundecaprenol N-acetyl-beta-D-mannosaminyltransferase